MRIVVHRADIIRVSTQVEVERLIRHGISNHKVHLMYFYIDAEQFHARLIASTAAQEVGRMLFVGRLSYQKDVGTLIRAMVHVHKAHPHAKLALLGGGELNQKYQALARALGVSEAIEFIGSIPYDKVAREFKRASLFTLASLYEGTCMVLHEAAVAGLPIVSTSHAGALDFVRNGREGYITPIRDHKALGDALVAMLSKPEYIRICGEAARARVQEFTRKEALESWERLIAKIASIKNSR
jgi:glycosyltransferase involved in cell wall biosynthesis